MIKHWNAHIGPIALWAGKSEFSITSHTQLCVKLVVFQTRYAYDMIVPPDIQGDHVRSGIGEYHPYLPVDNDLSTPRREPKGGDEDKDRNKFHFGSGSVWKGYFTLYYNTILLLKKQVLF